MKNSTKAERRRARDLGLSVGELRTLELLESIDERLRWAQLLGYTAQYVLKWKGVVTDEELETVLEAVSGSIEREPGERKRREILGQIRNQLAALEASIEASDDAVAEEDSSGGPPAG